jgi:hypothetical protein
MIAAGLLADRIAARENSCADMFDPNRVTVKSAPKTAKTQLWVAKHMIGDRLTTPTRIPWTTCPSTTRASCAPA